MIEGVVGLVVKSPTYCNPLQHTATYCNTLQPIAVVGLRDRVLGLNG